MEPFHVDAFPVRIIMTPPSNRFVEAVKTGNLYRYVGRKVTTEVTAPIGLAPHGYARATIGFSFWW
jgi:hypothetical protein